MKKLSTEAFIAKAVSLHGNKYDYSKVVYIKARDKVEIVCKDHGSFWQTPDKHTGTRRQGCPTCGVVKVANQKYSNSKDFALKGAKVHNGFFDYSLVDYVNSKTPVIIVCPKHGQFKQQPAKHLLGSGCKQCGQERINAKNTKSFEEFVKEARAVHGDKYEYSADGYTKRNVKLLIKCPDHGEFRQTGFSHLAGSGCPDCAVSGFKPHLPATLYLAKVVKPYCTFWKIGITNRSVTERFAADAVNIASLKTWENLPGTQAKAIESLVLGQFKKYRIKDFLFSLLKGTGNTECFQAKLPTARVITFIEKQLSVSSP